jgi:hypothetical protein
MLGSEQNFSQFNYQQFDQNPKLGKSKEKSYKSSDGKKRFFLGIIDTLTLYNWKKKFEFGFKYTFVSKKISCLPPMDYHFRFYQFINDAIEIDEEEYSIEESILEKKEPMLMNQLTFKKEDKKEKN